MADGEKRRKYSVKNHKYSQLVLHERVNKRQFQDFNTVASKHKLRSDAGLRTVHYASVQTDSCTTVLLSRRWCSDAAAAAAAEAVE